MISTVIHIMVLLQLTGINNINGCLPWDYDRHSVRFKCRTEGSRTVRLVDNHEEDVARCVFKGSSGKCSSYSFVKSIIRENLVTFRIDRKLKIDLNGNWSCLLQDNQYRAEVLTSRDLTDSTTVNLIGKIVEDGDVQRLLLTCSSCRIPKGKHVEFLVNNSSEDIITFNNETGKCTSLHGECTPSKCNCSFSGNTFALFLLLKKQMTTNTNFSCEMKFEDKENSIVFSKVPTLSFNGKEFKYKGTQTVRTTYTDVHNRPKDTENDTVGKVITGISITVVMAIFLTVAVYSYLKRRRCEKKKKPDEITPLIGDNSEESKSGNTNLKNEIESRLGEITDTITEAETRLNNERSEIGVSLKNHNEAPQTDLMTMIESFLKTFNEVKTAIHEVDLCIKKYIEPQTTFTNVKKEIEIHGGTSDVDHVQTLNNSKQASKDCSITEDTNQKSEIHAETLDVDHVQTLNYSKQPSIHSMTQDEHSKREIHGETSDVDHVQTLNNSKQASKDCSITEDTNQKSEIHAETPDVDHVQTLNYSKQPSIHSMTQDEHSKRDSTKSDPSSQTEPCREDPQVDTNYNLLSKEKFDLEISTYVGTQLKNR